MLQVKNHLKSVNNGKFSTPYIFINRVQELNEKANPEIIISIVGNKIDLDNHQVSKEEAETYCQKLGLHYYEVSAK